MALTGMYRGTGYGFQGLESRILVFIEGFSYDLKMKTRRQNGDTKQTEIERFDWFIEWIQTRMAFGWLSENSGEKTCQRTF